MLRAVCALCVLCFLNYCFCIQVILLSKLKAMRGDADQVADVRNRRANIFSSTPGLVVAQTL